MADFGQTDFGQFFDRLWPIVVLTDFDQTDFGQFLSVLVFWPNFLVLLFVLLCCTQPPKTQTLNVVWERGPALRGPTCSGFGVVVVVVVVVVAGLDFPGPPSAGPPSIGTPLRRTAQNFALFLPLPATVSLFFSLSLSLWRVFSLNFGGV